MSSTGCILFRLEESLKELAEKSLERWILAIETTSRGLENPSSSYLSSEGLDILRQDIASCVKGYEYAVTSVTASGGPQWYNALLALSGAQILERKWGNNGDSKAAVALVRQARIDYYAAQEAGQ